MENEKYKSYTNALKDLTIIIITKTFLKNDEFNLKKLKLFFNIIQTGVEREQRLDIYWRFSDWACLFLFGEDMVFLQVL